MNQPRARAVLAGSFGYLFAFGRLRPVIQAQRSRGDECGPGARLVYTRAQRSALLGAFALILIFRLPHAWLHGRFQDEEATVFLAYAWHHAWADALFRLFGGYWNLGANASTLVVARLVKHGAIPLERAPYLPMTIALGVQLLPGVLLLTGEARWLAHRFAVVVGLLIVAIMPVTEEVFFNVLHIQFHLALCAGLILALDIPRRPAVNWSYAALLLVAPLCGPGAIVILPLFAARAIFDRERGRASQLIALATGSAVQLLFFYGASPIRGNSIDPVSVAAAMFVRFIALPIDGFGVAKNVADVIHRSQLTGGVGWWSFAAIAVLLFVALVALASKRRDSAIWFVLSGLSIAAASLSFGLASVNRQDLINLEEGERYNFLPLVLLGLGVVVLATRAGHSRRPCVVLCLLILLSGASYYFRPLQAFAVGPSWPAQVAAWRSDHHHQLAVWPRPWTADLSDENRLCSPIGKDLTNRTDPRYCESGWLKSFFEVRNRHLASAPTLGSSSRAMTNR